MNKLRLVVSDNHHQLSLLDWAITRAKLGYDCYCWHTQAYSRACVEAGGSAPRPCNKCLMDANLDYEYIANAMEIS